MSYELIVWDCDGCLIDSEIISCGSAAQVLTQFGYPITAHEFMTRYMGRGWQDIYDEIEQETKKPFREIMPYDRVVEARDALFETELKAIPYVRDVLTQLTCKQCIASGSEPERLEKTLKITDLYEQFKGKIYSADQVEHGKPAPDIFLFAAAQMGVDPSKCLVIEDGMHGISGAKAAGMTVFAFLGGGHMHPDFVTQIKALQPDALFDDMRELAGMVGR